MSVGWCRVEGDGLGRACRAAFNRWTGISTLAASCWHQQIARHEGAQQGPRAALLMLPARLFHLWACLGSKLGGIGRALDALHVLCRQHACRVGTWRSECQLRMGWQPTDGCRAAGPSQIAIGGEQGARGRRRRRRARAHPVLHQPGLWPSALLGNHVRRAPWRQGRRA